MFQVGFTLLPETAQACDTLIRFYQLFYKLLIPKS